MRLDEQGRFGRIESECEQIQRRIERVLPQLIGVADRRQRVQVGNEIETIVLFLQINVLTNRAKKIAPMGSTGRLDSRKNTHEDALVGRGREEIEYLASQWHKL